MTQKFGVEIEFYGLGNRPASVASAIRIPGVLVVGENYNHQTRDYWKVVTDGSVYDGAELVSPPLAYNAANLAQVKSVFDKLKELNCYTNERCGTHVHVDATFLHNYSMQKQQHFFAFVVAAFQAHEDVFDRLVKGHRNNNSFCRSTKGKTWREVNDERYHKLNLNAFSRHGTIEFRQLQGTINSDVAIAWINLCVTFMHNTRTRFESQYALIQEAARVNT